MADISTTNLDAGTDSPRTARAQLLEAVQRINATILSDGRISIGTNSTTTPRDSLLVRRAITGLTDCHAVRDESTISSVSDYGGYGVFDAAPTVSGTHTHNHIFSFQDRPVYSGTGAGKLENSSAVYSQPTFNGPVDNRFALRVRDALGAGTVGENAGLLVEQLSRGTNNFAVFTQGTTPSVFGGRVLVGFDTTPAVNEGVAHYGQRLTGTTQVSFQASGLGLGATSGYVGFQSTPIMVTAASNITDITGFRARDMIKEAGPTVTNQVGFSVDDLTIATNAYGFISTLVAGANKWAMYRAGAAKSILDGKRYIGGTSAVSPTATVHIQAGTTAANSAPIKIVAGSLMTTPEAGAIESDGTHIYWTTAAGVRKQLD